MHLWQAHWDNWFYGVGTEPTVEYREAFKAVTNYPHRGVKEDHVSLIKWGLAVPGGLL